MRHEALGIRALAIAAALVIAGCAAFERAVPEALRPGAPRERAVETPSANELVAYLARLRGMNERSLAAEVARQREMARTSPGDLGQIKVALALSLSSLADESEVISLVDPIVRRDNADDDLRAMASFLHVQALERRRHKESAAAAGAKLREERRATETQKQRADALQEKAAQLQQKLDALTELEKSLSDRQAQGR
ncbi:MAG TPA: hypothetical protein VM073_09645 [Usitatibacter sp.]|nr:hypothetical protein [Usitatibacter sp.]